MRIVILFLILTSNIIAEEIIGIPKIVDGDTVHINEYKIRLEGIDAPEIRQKCKKEKLKISSIIGFTFYKDYNCGKVSRENLKKKVDRSKIKCISSSKDRYERYLAVCFKEKINLNRWMVRNGQAVAYRRYSKEYIPDEDFAKENKLGLWQGKFLYPEKWRKLN
jgi:endonuclease YncB( thermonuclease family)